MNKDVTLMHMLIGFGTLMGTVVVSMFIIMQHVSSSEARLRSEFKSDIAALRTELKGDIAALRAELKADIADLRMELKGDIAALRAELKGDIARLESSIERIEENERYFLTELAHLRGAFESAQLISPRVGAPQSAPQAPSGG